jgi:hypothetical protein
MLTSLDSIVMRVAKSVFDEIMEDTFQLLEERSLRPGRGDHQYWYLSAACSLVSIQFEPQRTQLLEREACDRVCRLLYKVLSLQDDPLEVSLAREVSPIFFVRIPSFRSSFRNNVRCDANLLIGYTRRHNFIINSSSSSSTRAAKPVCGYIIFPIARRLFLNSGAAA